MCCLIHISIIIPRHFLYLIFSCPCLSLVLFMLCLCDLFYMFIFIFIIANRMISWIQIHLFFCLFLEYVLLFLDDLVDQENKQFSSNNTSHARVLLSICLIFCQFQSGFGYKSVAYKNMCGIISLWHSYDMWNCLFHLLNLFIFKIMIYL